MRSAIRRLCQLSLHEAYLLFAIAVVQFALGAALRLLTVRTVRRLIVNVRAPARGFVKGPEDRLAWAIEAAGRRLSRVSTCLVRALAAELLLGDGGRGRVKIGVRRTAAGTLESHAWFERDGRTVVGGGAANYVDFMTLDSDAGDRR